MSMFIFFRITLKMLIYEKNQKVKFSMIRKGIQDAKCKKMGKFN